MNGTNWQGRYVRVIAPAGFEGHPKRRAVYCQTRNEARDVRSRIKKFKLDKKHPPVWSLEFSEQDRERLAGLKAEIGDLSLLPRIIEHWRKTSEEAVQKITVEKLVESFLEWRSEQGEWSPSTAEDTISRLGTFKLAFGFRWAHEITSQEIDKFLTDRGALGTRVKYFNKLRPLFRYAKRNRYVMLDPMEGIEPPVPEYTEIQIYTPDELARMLAVAEDSYEDLVPCLACLAFGFLRTEELVPRFQGDAVLDWSAFDWLEKTIFVPHRVAKKAKALEGNDRPIRINEALTDWLKPYVQSSGPVVEREKMSAYRALAKIRRAAGARNLPNGLRHSCISYWLAAHGEEAFGTVARWSGNSPAIIKRHYLAVLKPSEGGRWLAIRRAA